MPPLLASQREGCTTPPAAATKRKKRERGAERQQQQQKERAEAGGGGRIGQGEGSGPVAVIQLTARPKNLYVLWAQWEHSIKGVKPQLLLHLLQQKQLLLTPNPIVFIVVTFILVYF